MRTVSRRSRINLAIDVALLVGIVVSSNRRFTGAIWHEWIAIGFTVVLVVHLWLHTEWMVRLARRLWPPRARREALKWLVDLATFVTLGGAIITGVLASKHALATLGIDAPRDRAWGSLHGDLSELLLLPLGLHVALNWRWFVSMCRSLVGRRRVAVSA